ncbi:MAG: cupin domain-containing protein [Fimbriimonadaceae bacterium]|nr:cupin domain-containing protein [Fimbriimonadaceae bacterium]
MPKVNLVDAFAQIDAYWSPRIVAELNGQHVKLAKLKGEFVWHAHPDEDELFLVVAGRLTLEMREGNIELCPGEFYVVPRGVEHRPVAHEEAHVLLFEPAGTRNTGDAGGDRTVDPEWL